ncbi:MAG: NAD-dependent epimerase/dehydratase family protein [Candidatus Manganitrophaceae bacterium]|nr:MAG: NAD-dependent epimerase/dehydratase family protein [Candidatus Manganitrophaceae bacterium]
MRYFITGATGFVGGKIARQLVAAGHQVVALARHPAQAHDLTRLGVTLSPGDITDKESLRAPMTGVDGLFHVAGWYKIGSKTPSLGKRINIDGTRNVLELMRELRIPKGVYTSTLLIFSDTQGRQVDETHRYNGPWLSEYERTKWIAHTQIAEPMMKEGLPLVIVMPGLVYGPGDTSSVRNLFLQYLRRRLPIVPQKTAYAWGHVEDIARGHLLAMERGRPGESYLLTGPAHTLLEAFQIAEQITGIKASPVHPAPGLLKGLAALVRAVEPFLPLPELYRSESIRAIAGVTYLGSSRKAQRELGFTARPLEEGLCETLLHEMKRLGINR